MTAAAERAEPIGGADMLEWMDAGAKLRAVAPDATREFAERLLALVDASDAEFFAAWDAFAVARRAEEKASGAPDERASRKTTFMQAMEAVTQLPLEQATRVVRAVERVGARNAARLASHRRARARAKGGAR